jgi:CRP-like cAMP-binding protein
MTYPHKQTHCPTCKNRSSCFKVLSRLDHKFVEANRVELKFRAGEVICKQGAFASSIMYIYEGMVKTYLETPEGSHVILNILPTGSMVGLSSLFTDHVFNQSAAALVDSTICSIDIKVFEEFTKSNGEFAVEIIKSVNQCIISNNERFLSLTHKQLNGRFADAMIFLADKVYKSKKFELTMMRKDLAELTGMSPESITRVIAQFKKEKIIDVQGKNYHILKMDRLQEISVTG